MSQVDKLKESLRKLNNFLLDSHSNNTLNSVCEFHILFSEYCSMVEIVSENQGEEIMFSYLKEAAKEYSKKEQSIMFESMKCFLAKNKKTIDTINN